MSRQRRVLSTLEISPNLLPDGALLYDLVTEPLDCYCTQGPEGKPATTLSREQPNARLSSAVNKLEIRRATAEFSRPIVAVSTIEGWVDVKGRRPLLAMLCLPESDLENRNTFA